MYSLKLVILSLTIYTVHLSVGAMDLWSHHKKKVELTNTSSGKNYLSLINQIHLRHSKS